MVTFLAPQNHQGLVVRVHDHTPALNGMLEMLDGGGYGEELSVERTVVDLGVVQLPAEEGKGLVVAVMMLMKNSPMATSEASVVIDSMAFLMG